MVEIPQFERSVDRIFEFYERNADDWRRPHLGASVIGSECDRYLYYHYHWARKPDLDGRMFRLFARGDREEGWIIEDLRKAGFIVWDKMPGAGGQWKVEDGPFAGSAIDGVIMNLTEAPKTRHLLEVKTYNEKRFRKLQKEGVREADMKYYVQMQVYCAAFALERWFFVAVNKNNDEIYQERGPVDRQIASAARFRHQMVTSAEVPPPKISESPAFYKCKMCDYHPVCHGGALPALSCRTCTHVEKSLGGWTCTRHDRALTTEDQREGCGDWERGAAV